MKTKYILHGGYARQINPENDRFFKEILKDTGEKVSILLVEFAADPEKVSLKAEADKNQFERIKGNKKLNFTIANELFFTKQVELADVVYIAGGTTPRLLEVMSKYGDLSNLFSGKVVAGESAGANVLSAYCYSKFAGGVLRCLGLIPVKIIPHYAGEHPKEIEKLPGNLEMLLLPEYQYRVFSV